MHSFFNPGASGQTVHHVIQLHHDVSPDAGLNLDGPLWGQQHLFTAVGRLEFDAFFRDLR